MDGRVARVRKVVAGIITMSLALVMALPPVYARAEGDVADSYPEAFDLRSVYTDGEGDRCYVTPVKLQNPFGTCWGFAAIASAETSILGSHLADDPEAYRSLNLSEKQLAFFVNTHIDDPTSSQYGEGIYSSKYELVDGEFVPTEPITSEDYYNTGGSPFLATNTFAAGTGPTRESRDEALEYHGKERKTVNRDDGEPFCYSANDDWTLGEEYRYMRDYVLKESYFLPSPASWGDAGDGEAAYRYNAEGTIAIKQQLLQKRAVEIAFHADTSRPWSTGYGQYMDIVNWAHYTYDGASANHAVTIVGWDDNYAASNFAHEVYQLADKEGEYKPDNFKTDEGGNYVVDEKLTALTTPPADGAWLVKNSWGSGEEDFPNNGGGDWGIPVQKTDDDGNPVFDEHGDPVMVGSGYFWLSYYDQSLQMAESFVFDTSITGTGGIYDQDTLHCNQYDLMPVNSMSANESDELMKTANVFSSETGEHVMCATYITNTANTTVTVDVYLLHDGFANPEDGVLLASHTQTRELAGFYIDYLEDTPVPIQPGQSYSVVVTQRQDTGQYAIDYPVSFGPGNAYIEAGLSNSFGVAVMNGESYLYQDGHWANWQDEKMRDEFLGMHEECGIAEGITNKMLADALNLQFDNFPIKTYAFDCPESIFVRLAGGTDKLSLCVGTDTTASLEIYGDDSEGLTIADFANTDGIKLIDWRVGPGSEGLVELVPSEDGTQAQVKGLATGTAYVVASILDKGTLIIPVEVHEHGWGEPSYTWAPDDSSVTATRVCGYDASHVESETVAPTSVTVKEPTTSSTGQATLTATFTNPAFATQSKTVELAELEPSGQQAPSGQQSSAGKEASSSQQASSGKQTSSGASTAKTAASATSSMVAASTSLPKTGDTASGVATLALLCASFVAMAAGRCLRE